MIRSAITVSLVSEARGGPFVFWDDLPGACRAAQSLGFDAIEIFPPAPDAIEPNELRTMLADHRLKLAAVGTGAGWVKHRLQLCSSDATVRRNAREFIKNIIEFAAANQAPAIIGSMQGRSGDGVDHATAIAFLGEALEELGAFAASFGVPLLYEPLNRYETNLVNTVESGVRLLQTLSTTNVKLLADLFHMNIEEVNIADAIRAGKNYIGHLHFVDSNRRPAGCGHLDFRPIAAALRDIDYRGYASAEALPFPDSPSAAAQTMQTFRAVFRPEARAK